MPAQPGTSTGRGCGNVPYDNCQQCITARAYQNIPSCGLYSNANHPKRKFDGRPKKHCSSCPHPEGCVMCDL